MALHLIVESSKKYTPSKRNQNKKRGANNLVYWHKRLIHEHYEENEKTEILLRQEVYEGLVRTTQIEDIG
jgi:hypothetical protein